MATTQPPGRRNDYIPTNTAQFKAFAQNLLDYVLARTFVQDNIWTFPDPRIHELRDAPPKPTTPSTTTSWLPAPPSPSTSTKPIAAKLSTSRGSIPLSQ